MAGKRTSAVCVGLPALAGVSCAAGLSLLASGSTKKTIMRGWRNIVVAAVLIAGFAVVPAETSSGSTSWIVESGEWSEPANWSAGVPDGGDTAYVDNGGTVQLSSNEAASQLFVGYNATGTVNQTSGLFIVPWVTLARNPGSQGTYTSSGGQLVTGNITFGSGTGTFIYDGGQIVPTSPEGISLGFGDGTNTFLMESGDLLVERISMVTDWSNTFIQNGGNVTTKYILLAPDKPGPGSATYEMNGGTLTLAAGDGYWDDGSVGISDGATFNQTGGEVTITGNLFIGNTLWGSDPLPLTEGATYRISGGELHVESNLPDSSSYDVGIVVGSSVSDVPGVLEAAGGTIETTTLYVAPCFYSDYGSAEGVGEVHMSGGEIRLSGPLSPALAPSTIGGELYGYGSIVSTGQIRVLMTGHISASGGVLTLDADMQSSGTVEVAAASTLRTHGVLGGSVDNAGTLHAYGGDLRLTGDVTNSGTLSNSPGKDLIVHADSLTHTGDIIANIAGVISFDQAISVAPSRQIVLNGGVVSAPQISNQVGGTVTGTGALAGDLLNAGTTDFFGPVQIFGNLDNTPTGHVGIRNGDLLITGNTTNDGMIKVLNGQVYFEGGLTNNGTVDLDPAMAVVTADLVVGITGAIVADAGSELQLLGNFENQSIQAGSFDLSVGTVKFNGSYIGGPQGLEVAGKDFGASPDGFDDNFAFGDLVLDQATIQLTDLYDNRTDWASPEALYVTNLTINPGSTIDPGLLKLYYLNGGGPKQFFLGDASLDGVVDIVDLTALAANWSALTPGNKAWWQGDFSGDMVIDIIDLTALSANWGAQTVVVAGGTVPEPATLVLLALGGVAMIRRRR